MMKLRHSMVIALVFGAACGGSKTPKQGAGAVQARDAAAQAPSVGDTSGQASTAGPYGTLSSGPTGTAPNPAAAIETSGLPPADREPDALNGPQPGVEPDAAAKPAATAGPSSNSELPAAGDASVQSGSGDALDASRVNETPEAGVSIPVEAAAPPVRLPRPELVVSGPNAYWATASVTEASESAVIDLTVDSGTRLQAWDGFGGSFEEWGWEALQRLAPSEQQRAMRLLFDANEGANFVWGRLPIGATEYALDRYSLDDVEDDYELEHFSIEREQLRVVPYLQAALEVNPRLRLLAMPWSPPAWMKDNASMDRGSIRSEPPVLSAYAHYLARYVEAYEGAGFDIEAIHVQNDITWVDDLPSCEWDAPTIASFVGEYLGPAFLERGVDAEIWLGEFGILNQAAILDQVMADPVAASFISGISLSWDTWSIIERLQEDYALPVAQTRHEPGNSPWLPDFNPDAAPNDFAYAVHTWELLYNWINGGVNSYLAWNMLLDEHDAGLNSVRLWPKNTLLHVDPETNTLVVTPAYYVFRHLSYFVDPGAVRLGVSGASLQALAFENPDGSIAVAVRNSATQQATVTLSVGGRKPRFDVPASGWATLFLDP